MSLTFFYNTPTHLILNFADLKQKTLT